MELNTIEPRYLNELYAYLYMLNLFATIYTDFKVVL